LPWKVKVQVESTRLLARQRKSSRALVGSSMRMSPGPLLKRAADVWLISRLTRWLEAMCERRVAVSATSRWVTLFTHCVSGEGLRAQSVVEPDSPPVQVFLRQEVEVELQVAGITAHAVPAFSGDIQLRQVPGYRLHNVALRGKRGVTVESVPRDCRVNAHSRSSFVPRRRRGVLRTLP